MWSLKLEHINQAEHDDICAGGDHGTVTTVPPGSVQRRVWDAFKLDVRSDKERYDGVDLDALRRIHAEKIRNQMDLASDADEDKLHVELVSHARAAVAFGSFAPSAYCAAPGRILPFPIVCRIQGQYHANFPLAKVSNRRAGGQSILEGYRASGVAWLMDAACSNPGNVFGKREFAATGSNMLAARDTPIYFHRVNALLLSLLVGSESRAMQDVLARVWDRTVGEQYPYLRIDRLRHYAQSHPFAPSSFIAPLYFAPISLLVRPIRSSLHFAPFATLAIGTALPNFSDSNRVGIVTLDVRSPCIPPDLRDSVVRAHCKR
ncbi:hypothetical protein OQA88_9531 [Cercophora sp. LCS_1]